MGLSYDDFIKGQRNPVYDDAPVKPGALPPVIIPAATTYAKPPAVAVASVPLVVKTTPTATRLNNGTDTKAQPAPYFKAMPSRFKPIKPTK